MSYQTNSALVTAQAKLLGAFQSQELRYREPVVFKSFIQQAPFMFPSYEALKTRDDRAIDTKYLTRSSRSLDNARAHNHTGAVGASGNLALSWTTYADQFKISLKQGDNNVYGLQEMLNNEIQNLTTNMIEGLESVAADYVFANKSGVNVATVEGSFNGTNDAFEITESSNGNRTIQIAKQVMHINKYSGQYVAFCDTVAFNKFEYLNAQGGGNSVNSSFQFQNAGIEFIHSVDLDTDSAGQSYTKGYFILVPVGAFGVLDWIPRQNREGVSTKENMYGTLSNPVDGLQYAVHSYEERADGTATGGYTQDVVTQYEGSIDLAFHHAPLSTADSTPFMAFALV